MKTKRIFKIGLGLTLVAFLGLISFKTFAKKHEISEVKNENIQSQLREDKTVNDNVSITIDSNTSTKDFEEIQKMLKDEQITASFSNIVRNDSGKLTSLKIVLKDNNGNQAESQIASNLPISQVVFGRKDGALYITQSNKETGAFAFFNRPNMMPFGLDNDSLSIDPFASFGSFGFNDFFNDEDDSFFLNGKSMKLDELKEQMKKQLGSIHKGQNFSWFFDSNDGTNLAQKFRFIDDPDTNKMIFIDGKDSDFKTLDILAKTHKLEAVDVLKPTTAMSLYGDKGKDGAIIATTKTHGQ